MFLDNIYAHERTCRKYEPYSYSKETLPNPRTLKQNMFLSISDKNKFKSYYKRKNNVGFSDHTRIVCINICFTAIIAGRSSKVTILEAITVTSCMVLKNYSAFAKSFALFQCVFNIARFDSILICATLLIWGSSRNQIPPMLTFYIW